ncbi:MAG: ATP-binding protein [Acidobacteria bacterium]|nr:ATP-binding protein [Acidobacteriota bacterium]
MGSLKRKLQFSYGLLILIILMACLWGIYHSSRLGRAIDDILVHNYKSILAAENMKEALERQDSAVLFWIAGQIDKAAQQFSANREKFLREFGVAANNITEPGEKEIISDIQARYSSYRRHLERIIETKEPAAAADLSAHYFTQLEPAFLALKSRLDDLLQLNQQAMVRASDRAKAESRRAQTSTILFTATALVLALLFVWRFTTYVVNPISALTDKAKKIAEGDFDQHIEVQSEDEIGVLAAEFNRMALRLRELRKSDYWRLLLEQKKSDAVIDSLYEPVIVTDARGEVTKTNRAAKMLFDGTSAGGTEQLSLSDFSAGQQVLKAVRDAVSMQRPVAAEGEAAVVPVKLGGSERSYRLRTTPVRDEDGRLVGVVTLLEDITALRELDQLKTQFISVASAKLRAPLRALQMALHTVIDGGIGDLNDQQKDMLLSARDDAAQLEELMADLLELAEIESGARHVTLAPFRPIELVRPVVERHRPSAECKHVELEVEVWPDLPRVIADKQAVARMLDNLLSNAIRHTGHNGRVTVLATERQGRIFFSIQDTGEGIPPDYLPTLFGRFVQVGAKPGGGTGLGLALVKRLVEAQGGQVSVESRVGEGSTLTFTLPVVESPMSLPEERKA